MDAVLPTSGKYVVAVSGGVDSMVLLHALYNMNLAIDGHPWKLTVAHLDHGMRKDSAEDRQLVQKVAWRLDLPFVYEEAQLGAATSEAAARAMRYGFLRRVQRESGARAIVTAHHWDDVLETAIINLLRGSGRKGLTALNSRHDLIRPLLAVPKRELVAYARDQGLHWREDSTNQNTDYLRNYVRHRLLARFDEPALTRLCQIINDARRINDELDILLVKQLHFHAVSGRLERPWFNTLPHIVALEVMAAWLRTNRLHDFDSRTLEHLVVAAKVAVPGRKFDVSHGVTMIARRDHLALAIPER